jgi:putative transposase
MVRLTRVVVPGLPHHVTQRGNGRARTFFGEGDYRLCRDLLAEHCRAAGVEVWAWCLMPNRVHLILVPADEDGLRRALAWVHRRYAGIVNARRKRRGHFWQGRFGSVAMDEANLAAAVRYLALDPVRARLVPRAQDWRWSSVRAHLSGRDDGLTTLRPVLERFASFRAFLDQPGDAAALARLRAAEGIGRQVGEPGFLTRLERLTKRKLRPPPPRPQNRSGPPPRRRAGSFSALSPESH